MDELHLRFTRALDRYPAPGRPEAPAPGATTYPVAVLVGLGVALLLTGGMLAAFLLVMLIELGRSL